MDRTFSDFLFYDSSATKIDAVLQQLLLNISTHFAILYLMFCEVRMSLVAFRRYILKI